jgi:hypothetical protein
MFRKKNVADTVEWTPYVGCWSRARLPRTDATYTSDQLVALREYAEDARRRRSERRRRGGRR